MKLSVVIVSSRTTQQGRPEAENCDGHGRKVDQEGFKPTHPTRQAGRCTNNAFCDDDNVCTGFKPTHPTRQAGSLDTLGGVLRAYGHPSMEVSSRPTQQGRPEACWMSRPRSWPMRLAVSSRPTQQGRPEVAPWELLHMVQDRVSLFQADPPNKAGRKPTWRSVGLMPTW